MLEVLVPGRDLGGSSALARLREIERPPPVEKGEPAAILRWEHGWELAPAQQGVRSSCDMDFWESCTDNLLDLAFLPGPGQAGGEPKKLHFMADHDLRWVECDRVAELLHGALWPFAFLVDVVTLPVQIPILVITCRESR